MASVRTLARLAIVGMAIAGFGSSPLAGQGFGGSLAVGGYGSSNSLRTNVGVGASLVGRVTSRSGFGVGLGARVIRYESEDNGFAFLEVQYAPAPTLTRRIQPIAGLRAGLYRAAGDFDDDPRFGLEGGPVGGIAIRAGGGVSLTLTGDLGIILDSNLYFGQRRFIPGAQVGITLH